MVKEEYDVDETEEEPQFEPEAAVVKNIYYRIVNKTLIIHEREINNIDGITWFANFPLSENTGMYINPVINNGKINVGVEFRQRGCDTTRINLETNYTEYNSEFENRMLNFQLNIAARVDCEGEF
jgi:hypothetical protein